MEALSVWGTQKKTQKISNIKIYQNIKYQTHLLPPSGLVTKMLVGDQMCDQMTAFDLF